MLIGQYATVNVAYSVCQVTTVLDTVYHEMVPVLEVIAQPGCLIPCIFRFHM